MGSNAAHNKALVWDLRYAPAPQLEREAKKT